MRVRINRVKMVAAMAQLDMTSLKLSELTGISKTTITSVRNGKSCSKATASKLAAVLGQNIIEKEA